VWASFFELQAASRKLQASSFKQPKKAKTRAGFSSDAGFLVACGLWLAACGLRLTS
jgi:hypothetical protein